MEEPASIPPVPKPFATGRCWYSWCGGVTQPNCTIDFVNHAFIPNLQCTSDTTPATCGWSNIPNAPYVALAKELFYQQDKGNRFASFASKQMSRTPSDTLSRALPICFNHGRKAMVQTTCVSSAAYVLPN